MAQEEVKFEIDENIEWATLNEVLKAKYDTTGLVIKYIDDENEEIDIATQNEYENAYTLAALLEIPLKFVIRKSNGQVVDQVTVNIKKKPVEVKPVEPIQKVEEEKLINFDSQIDISTMINSRLVNSDIAAAIPLVNKSEANISDTNPPKWFIDGIANLKQELLNEFDAKFKYLNEKIEELKLQDQQRLNNSNVLVDAEPSLLLSIETVQNLINQLEMAKLLKDIIKVRDIEEKLTTLNAFNAKFIRDCNIPDGTKFEVNSKFKKSWLLQNNGRLAWLPTKIKLINISANIECTNKVVELPFVDANGFIEVEVELIAPGSPGNYLSEWVLTYQNYMFGPRIWCDIQVIDSSNKVEEIKAPTPTPVPEAVNLEVKIPEQITTDKQEQQQLESQFIISPTAFNRKLSSSTTFDEKVKDLYDISDDDAEFVIIPDCLDLTKKWNPPKTADISLDDIDDDFKLRFEEPTHVKQQQNTDDQVNTSMMLLNELLLIPKRKQEGDKVNNLMIFSESINDDKHDFDASIENINENNLNDTLKDEENLLLFSGDYSNLKDISHEAPNQIETNNLVEPTASNKNLIDSTPCVQNNTNLMIESSASAISDNNKLILTNENNKNENTVAFATNAVPLVHTSTVVEPTAPSYSRSNSRSSVESHSLNQQYSSLDPFARLISMGFANRQLNQKLLDKYNNDVQRVVDDLLNRQDNNWASNRH